MGCSQASAAGMTKPCSRGYREKTLVEVWYQQRGTKDGCSMQRNKVYVGRRRWISVFQSWSWGAPALHVSDVQVDYLNQVCWSRETSKTRRAQISGSGLKNTEVDEMGQQQGFDTGVHLTSEVDSSCLGVLIEQNCDFHLKQLRGNCCFFIPKGCCVFRIAHLTVK